jgi:hypothetical protein
MDSQPPETERLLMSANLHRMRGELNEAEAMVRAALIRNPSDVLAQEFLGDLLSQKGDVKGAEQIYRAILQDSPGKAVVEEKLARLILKSTPYGATSASGTPLRTDRNPATVLVASLVFPGGGHFYLGDKVKGLLFSAGTLLLGLASVPSLFAIVGPITSAMNQGLSGQGLENGGSLQTPSISAGSGVLMTLVGVLSTILYIYAAIDSYVVAKRVYRGR